MSKTFMHKHATCTCGMSPLTRRKSNAPSRRKSLHGDERKGNV